MRSGIIVAVRGFGGDGYEIYQCLDVYRAFSCRYYETSSCSWLAANDAVAMDGTPHVDIFPFGDHNRSFVCDEKTQDAG